MGVSADFVFFLICIKNGVFGADFEVINTRFTIEKFYEKMCLILHIYT